MEIQPKRKYNRHQHNADDNDDGGQAIGKGVDIHVQMSR